MITLIEDLLGATILTLVLVQQLRVRRLRHIPYVGSFLTVIGTTAFVILVVKHVVTVDEALLMVCSLAVTVGLAVIRGGITRLRRDIDGTILRQGGLLTVVLWLVAIGQHIAVGLLLPAGVGLATLSLFFGASLVTQVLALDVRARNLPDRVRVGSSAPAAGSIVQ
ncbi:hypothetical protein GCM10011575_31120 [Microlunatus endophyticus]|uniref:DUF1453 domain-containing protein n=1 Tax=Microlunatus endophyticus TaxID=1716077 RepID=A0A917SDX6_9ACTN|nr:hypothetical protein [Microlunatus endophyticus]GGL70438.1 hypothetical protein GCM10011575_31120 [Microlunatus endophyticus]